MNDCKNIILNYLSNDILFSVSREYMFKSLPSTVNIKSFEEYEQFKKWGRLFNPTNIETVIINITYPKIRLNTFSYSINYVPECVKNVHILNFDYVCPNTSISLPDNVEFIKIEKTMADVTRLPLNIHHLVLDYKYMGIVTNFNDTPNLETIELYGYNGGGRIPCQINDLPDTIKTIKLYVEFPGQITYWPRNVEVILEDTYNSDDDHDMLILFPPNDDDDYY
jgi:hypothetical protein